MAFGLDPDPEVKGRFYAALHDAGAVVLGVDSTLDLFSAHIRPRRAIRIDYGIDLDAVEAYRQDTDRSALRSRLGFAEQDVLMLCLGTFEPRKAQGLLAAAFARLAHKHPRAVLALVGDRVSPYSAAVHEVVRRLGLGDRIRLVPMTPSIPDWYLAADGFILRRTSNPCRGRCLRRWPLEPRARIGRVRGARHRPGR